MVTFQIVCLVAMVACCQSFSFSPSVVVRIRQHSSQSHQRQRGVTVFSQTEESNDSELTYYSPNAPLDESIYRYDLDDDEEELAEEAAALNTTSDDKDLAFFDEATIFVRGGSGGQGASTYKKGKGGSDGIPDGGDGGNGGDVIMVADYTLNTLTGLTLGWRPNSFGGSGASYKQADSQKSNSAARIKSFRAGTGRDGGRQFDNGRNGEAVEIRVPPGTIVQHEVEIKDEDGNVIDTEVIEIGQVTSLDPMLVVSQGGNGGDGSGVTRRAAAKGKTRRRAPPSSGERKKLKLVLKLVADIALVGVPNAGKSTFLASVTRAKPKIANVSFN
jgi:GTP-binding protein